MVEKLTKLYNTLLLVETKGDSTKIMANCLRFTEQMIVEAKTKEAAQVEESSEVGES